MSKEGAVPPNDSGSAVSLIRPEFAGDQAGGFEQGIMYTEKWYPSTYVQMQTPRGQTNLWAGIVENLPVPV